MTRTLLRAAWVAPMDGPIIENGAVAVEGSVTIAVGLAAELIRSTVGATVLDLGDAVILPGLVNAHTHLELSHLRPPPQPRRFIDWLLTVMRSDAPGAESAVTRGAAHSVGFGVTTVGDVTRDPAATRPLLQRATIRAVSYGEVTGMAARKHLMPARLIAAVAWDAHAEKGRVIPAISPHAPYSIDAEGYRACLQTARQRGLVLATHLAESPDEAQFLAHHTGPLRELWEALGAWEPNVPRFDGGPVRYAKALGLLDDPACALVHMNYCDDDELALLARGRASVVYCPRTHAYFGHPPHRWREMLAAGINVAVGTDSRASSPDLNLVDDLRLLHRLAPQVPAPTLWRMATVNAGRALGVGLGTLRPANPADMTIFRVSGSDPLTEILETDARPSGVWIAGRVAAS